MAEDTASQDPPSSLDPRSRESTAFEPPTYEIRYASDHTLEWDPPRGSKELALALSYHFPMEKDLESKMKAATKKFLKAEAKKRPLSLSSMLQKTRAAVARAGRRVRSEKQKDFQSASTSKPHQRHSELDEEPEQTVSNELRNEMESQLLGNSQSTLRTTPADQYATSGQYSEFSVPTSSLKQVQQPSAAPLEILKWDSGVNPFLKRRKKRQYGKEERAKVAANRGNACADHKRKKMKCDPQNCPQNKQNLMKLSEPQVQNDHAQSKDAESAGTSNAVTMAGLAMIPGTTGMTAKPIDASPTNNRDVEFWPGFQPLALEDPLSLLEFSWSKDDLDFAGFDSSGPSTSMGPPFNSTFAPDSPLDLDHLLQNTNYEDFMAVANKDEDYPPVFPASPPHEFRNRPGLLSEDNLLEHRRALRSCTFATLGFSYAAFAGYAPLKDICGDASTSLEFSPILGASSDFNTQDNSSIRSARPTGQRNRSLPSRPPFPVRPPLISHDGFEESFSKLSISNS